MESYPPGDAVVFGEPLVHEKRTLTVSALIGWAPPVPSSSGGERGVERPGEIWARFEFDDASGEGGVLVRVFDASVPAQSHRMRRNRAWYAHDRGGDLGRAPQWVQAWVRAHAPGWVRLP